MARLIDTIFDQAEYHRLGFNARTQMLYYRSAKGMTRWVDDAAFDLSKMVIGERFVRALAQRRSPLLEDPENGATEGGLLESLHTLQETLSVIERCEQAYQRQDDIAIHLKLDPYLEAFGQAYQMLRGHSLTQSSPQLSAATLHTLLEDAFHDYIARLQQEDFIKAARLKRTHTRTRQRSLTTYFQQLTEAYPSLEVIKLGLTYDMPAQQPLYARFDRAAYENLREPFSRFLNQYIQHADTQQLVGYIWTLDRVRSRGYCYHLILFFDPRHAVPASQQRQHLEDNWLRMTANPVAMTPDPEAGGIQPTQGTLPLACISDPDVKDQPQQLDSRRTCPSRYDGTVSAQPSPQREQLEQLLTTWIKCERLMRLELPHKHHSFGKARYRPCQAPRHPPA